MAGRKQYYKNRADDIRFKTILAICQVFLEEHRERDHEALNICARQIANALYDMTPIYSGRISAGCINAQLAAASRGVKVKKTKEHYHGRQRGGELALRSVLHLGAVDVRAVKKIVDRHRQVHLTSAAENTKLRAITDSASYDGDWKFAYRTMGIELGAYVPNLRTPKYDLSTFKLP